MAESRDSEATTRAARCACALVLTGGGARGAYQAGVALAASELRADRANPFPVITGTSAGAINAAVLASHAADFPDGARRLADIWRNLTVQQVFRTDLRIMLRTTAQWVLTVLGGGGSGRHVPRALLDNAPLRRLLAANIRFDAVQQAVAAGALRAFAVTASGYGSAQSVTFFDGVPELQPWQRLRREGRRSAIVLEHVMASIALPIIFPSVRLGREYFGDGSMRQGAPLSSAIHLGADKLLIVPVRNETFDQRALLREPQYPSFGEIAGYVLDTLFMDSLYTDLERLRRINRTLEHIAVYEDDSRAPRLRPIDTLVIAPSEDINEIAARHHRRFPRLVKVLLKRLGAHQSDGDQFISYLLFDGAFCGELVELGYQDAMARRDELAQFLAPESAAFSAEGI